MLDRFAPYLKWICLALAFLLAYQVAKMFVPQSTDHLTGVEDSFAFAPLEEPNESTNRTTDSASARPGSVPRVQVPPEVQSRIDLVEKSGMFGALPRPLPLALLGIGGEDAFVRAPNGQTGLLRVGEELGGIKLLRIGINHVVVEEDGKEKELNLFPGLGGK